MDSALKQRLLGAAVLIALAVIFLPMFFSSTPPKQENTTLGLNIPPAPERNFETRNLAVDAQNGNASAPIVRTDREIHRAGPSGNSPQRGSSDLPTLQARLGPDSSRDMLASGTRRPSSSASSNRSSTEKPNAA